MRDLSTVPESESLDISGDDDNTVELVVPKEVSSQFNEDAETYGEDEAGTETETVTADPDRSLNIDAAGEEVVLLDESEAEALIDHGRTTPLQPLSEDTVVSLEGKRMERVLEKAPMLRAFQRSNIGFVRTRNEDSSFIFTADTGGEEPLMPFGLYVVADGMGGHFAGHEASKSVSRIVANHVMQRIYMPMLAASRPTGPGEPVQEVMLDAVHKANDSIHSPDPEKDSGTTLTTALIIGRRLYVAHVGDSRAYLVEDNKLNLITTDHSYVRRLQEAGQLTEEEAAIHPHRNMLYMAVGQGGKLDIETFTQSLPQSGKLILCSDGLWGLVTEKMILEVLSKDGLTLKQMCDKLVDLALKAGGYDNITIVLVDFSF